jgi:hypothetical protein
MELWPPCCCVAAFVSAAFKQLRIPTAPKRELAIDLKTMVGPNDANPWRLPVTSEKNRRGVLLQDADETIRRLLQSHDSHFDFAHVPLSIIPLPLFDEVAQRAIDEGCVVGIGFARDMIIGGNGQLLHVARIVELNWREALLVDDALPGSEQEQRIGWDSIERACRKIDDGFWLIGPNHVVRTIGSPST